MFFLLEVITHYLCVKARKLGMCKMFVKYYSNLNSWQADELFYKALQKCRN